MSDKITKNDWDKILKELALSKNQDAKLVEKVRKQLKRTGEKEHERSLDIIKADIWHKKLLDLLKQTMNSNVAVRGRRLDDSPVSAMVSISRPKVRRVVSGDEILYQSELPVREITLGHMNEIQAEYLFKKIKDNPPKVEAVALYYKISWDAWNEVHLTVSEKEVTWRCPQWPDWESGKQSLKEAK